MFVRVGFFLIALLPAAIAWGEFHVTKQGQSPVKVLVDLRHTAGNGKAALVEAAAWLAESVGAATGTPLVVEEREPREGEAVIVLARSDVWPEVARGAGLKSESLEAYVISEQPKHLFLLGKSEAAVKYAVADLLRSWGYRWFAPSPTWHITPQRAEFSWTGNKAAAPALITRKIWYAYGHSASDLAPLTANYRRWATANRLSEQSLTQTGHSYGNIILRNQKTFDAHPEYYAVLQDGTRDSTRAIQARKFCTSNPELLDLVAADRLKLLEEQLKLNPAALMVSVDPSDGQGSCECVQCAKLGTTTDRVLHLANHVARKLREKHPAAWVGLYAYSSHRLPPTIDVEPNVYVQVAMGFNHTQYTLPELVERWSQKVGAIGLREYYGVEAWDWGLPGRMRGSQVEYHRKWIPFYAERKVNAINAETNSNWGGQTLGHYVAAQLMWNPQENVDALTDEYFQLCFGRAAETMRELYRKFDRAPALRGATLTPMFDDLKQALEKTTNPAIRERLIDLMAYLVYVAKYREFELAASREPERNAAFYNALQPLMQYAYQIRHRDTVHYYALARRLCNGQPLKDGRPDFYLANKEQKPVWMTGEALSNSEVQSLFAEMHARLQADKDPTVTFSRFLERVQPVGADAGASRIAGSDQTSVASFRKGMRGFFHATEKQKITLGVAATGKSATITVFVRDEEPLHRQELKGNPDLKLAANAFVPVEFELPKAGEYRVEITGDFALQVPPEVAFAVEASPTRPAWIEYSGPHYFYVPKGTKELYVDANPRLSLVVPGSKQKIDITAEQRAPGEQYVVIPVPEGAAGQVWHTTSNTRGQVMLLNIPPLLNFHRSPFLVPKEVAEADRLK